MILSFFCFYFCVFLTFLLFLPVFSVILCVLMSLQFARLCCQLLRYIPSAWSPGSLNYWESRGVLPQCHTLCLLFFYESILSTFLSGYLVVFLSSYFFVSQMCLFFYPVRLGPPGQHRLAHMIACCLLRHANSLTVSSLSRLCQPLTRLNLSRPGRVLPLAQELALSLYLVSAQGQPSPLAAR